ncbi:MAG: hypothetical protein KF774_07170 [Planctomyces sp.]|nr:hypothetical protein [Planctomyces sp.]
MPATTPHVLYCGDTTLQSAAGYLAGLLTRAGWNYTYIPSDDSLPAEALDSDWNVIVLSDYPAARLTAAQHSAIVQRVQHGAGLLMIGGWESFHGLGGDWDGTEVGGILPVQIASADDRFNCDQLLVARCCRPHPIVNGLPWDTRPPLLGGLNRVVPKPNSQVLLTAEQWNLRRAGDTLSLQRDASHPLLVVGESAAGRTAAFASDVAPHWIGPMVDWGLPRVMATAPDAAAIEVGSQYAEFFTRLVAWSAGGVS